MPDEEPKETPVSMSASLPWYQQPLSKGAALAVLEVFGYLATSLTMPWWAICLVLLAMWMLLVVTIVRSEWTIKLPLVVKGAGCLVAGLFVYALGAKSLHQAYLTTSTEGVTISQTSTPQPSPSSGSLADPSTVFTESPDPFPKLALGCIHIMPNITKLLPVEKGKFPFLKILGPEKDQYVVPIALYLDHGTLYADVTLYSAKFGVAFTLQGINYSVTAPDWDQNHNDSAIEVTDEYGTPIFQLIRKSRSVIRIFGLFEDFNVALAFTPKQFGRLVGPEGFMHGDYVPPADFLRPLFKHPGWKYPGQFASDMDPASECPSAIKGRASGVLNTLTFGP